MKTLRMTCQSSLRVARWRLANAERRSLEERLRSASLEDRIAALNARDGGAPAEFRAQSDVEWMWVGLFAVGAVAITSLILVLLMYWGIR